MPQGEGTVGSLFVAEEKKAKAEGKKCHAKTMGSKKKPIELTYIQRTPHKTVFLWG